MSNSKRIKTNRLILTVMLIAVVLTFLLQITRLKKDLHNVTDAKKDLLNEYIIASSRYIDSMRLFGDQYYKIEDPEQSSAYALLDSDDSGDGFHLDGIEGSELQNKMGNLTGIGEIPMVGDRFREINFALHLNDYFAFYHEQMPELQWIYYTSNSDFINLYPWTPSGEFFYRPILKDVPFFDIVTPERNPDQSLEWTGVYVDHAGKGLMVTLSGPFYVANRFIGVFSIDFTNQRLSELIESEYKAVLFDSEAIIASNQGKQDEYNIELVSEYFSKLKMPYVDVVLLPNDQVVRLGLNYVSKIAFDDAPWNLMVMTPVWKVVGLATIQTIPVLLVGVLLLAVSRENEKRKSTERALDSEREKLTETIVTLNEQEQQIAAFLELNLEMLAVLDLDGIIVKVNRRFCDVMKFRCEELIGKKYLDMVHPGDMENAIKLYEALKHQMPFDNFTNRVVDGDGVYKYLEWHMLPSFGNLIYASARDVSEKHEMEAKLSETAFRDQLTGAYNRHYLDSVIERYMVTAVQNAQPLTMIELDLDYFKQVNDTFGHTVGDAVLTQIVKIASQVIRSADFIVRYGGEEFIIIMPQTDQYGAAIVAEKVRVSVQNHKFDVCGPVTVSIGLSEYLEGENFEHWYNRVDQNLYTAKRNGRNQIFSSL